MKVFTNNYSKVIILGLSSCITSYVVIFTFLAINKGAATHKKLIMKFDTFFLFLNTVHPKKYIVKSSTLCVVS